MSEKVPKSRISTLTYFAIGTFALLSGFYVTSRIQHWHASGSVIKTNAEVKQDDQSSQERAKEYAAYKQVFLDKLSTYKALLIQADKAAAMKALNDHMSLLALIEAEYIKVKPSATEPERVKLKSMIGDYSTTLKGVTKLNYELVFIREARAEVTNAHSILFLTSSKLYAEDKKEVKKLLKDADQGTFNLYQSGTLLYKINHLTEIALYRMKPENQEATPEMRLEAGMTAIELYLNELTVFNAPTQKERE